MHNLYFVDTPWRFVNATEARFFFKASENTLVILETKNLLNLNQIHKILNKDDWNNIIYIPTNKKINYLNYAFYIKKLINNKYDNIFLGWSWLDQLIFANLDYIDAYIVDDGLSTITFYKNIKNRAIDYSQFFFKKLRFVFCGLKVYSRNNINFFTSFNLISFGEHIVIKHNFEILRATLDRRTKKSDEVCIIGQSLVEKGMLSKTIYISKINEICINYKDRKIIYIAHRDEFIISKHRDKIKSESFELLNINEPIEHYFLNKKTIPNTVVGFYSSALVNLDSLFGDEINCFFVGIKQSDILNEYKEVLTNNEIYYKFTNVKKLF